MADNKKKTNETDERKTKNNWLTLKYCSLDWTKGPCNSIFPIVSSPLNTPSENHTTTKGDRKVGTIRNHPT